jgi:aromatic ring-cleaving dioxygenase
METRHPLDVSRIESWHAHVYFDAATRDAAWTFRDVLAKALGERVVIGRFHERPVGPHPKWSYQVAFGPQQFAEVVGWLALNHGPLDVFLHPNTGDALRDHRDRAIWIGGAHDLNLDALIGTF